MKRAVAAVVCSIVVACSPSADEADTMSLGTVDTLKPASDSAAIAAAGATTAAAVPPSGVTKAPGTPATQSNTGTKAPPRDTTNIGRDRAIPINTKDPKVRLPTVDTTKRPPA